MSDAPAKEAKSATPNKTPAAALPPVAKAPSAKTDPTQVHVAGQWKHTRPLTACRFDPTGKFVFTGAEDYTVQRWNLKDEKPVLLSGHESWVRAMAFSPDGQTLYTGGYDGQLLTWPATADAPTPSRKTAAHDGWVRAVAVSPDGRLVATCGNDRLVKLWSATDGKLLHTLAGHESHVYNIAFHPAGDSLVSCDLKGGFRDWDTATGKQRREFKAESLHKYDTSFRADIGGARALAFGEGGKVVAAGGVTNVTNAFAGIGDPALATFEWESVKARPLHTSKESIRGLIWGMAWHADGYWAAAIGGPAGYLYFWKPEQAQETFKFKLPDTGRDMSLAPDGQTLVIAHADGNVRQYRLSKKV